MKRVLAIHDISGVGKCSLTVALPIISAAGVECSVMPTAVLSTHTGGFEGFTFRDLTEDMLPMARHWKREGVKFDAFYSGYLGSLEQIDIVREIFAMLKDENSIVMIDPVMADYGKLYSRFTAEHVTKMAGLCAHADIVVPNRTEAAFMLGFEYNAGLMTEAEVKKYLRGLAELGADKVVLTGAQFSADELGAACFDKVTGQIDYIMDSLIPGQYHGTGDVFGSFLIGALMRGKTLPEAVKIAVTFTCRAIKLTREAGTPPRMGVMFERVLGDFSVSF